MDEITYANKKNHVIVLIIVWHQDLILLKSCLNVICSCRLDRVRWFEYIFRDSAEIVFDDLNAYLHIKVPVLRVISALHESYAAYKLTFTGEELTWFTANIKRGKRHDCKHLTHVRNVSLYEIFCQDLGCRMWSHTFSALSTMDYCDNWRNKSPSLSNWGIVQFLQNILSWWWLTVR